MSSTGWVKLIVLISCFRVVLVFGEGFKALSQETAVPMKDLSSAIIVYQDMQDLYAALDTVLTGAAAFIDFHKKDPSLPEKSYFLPLVFTIDKDSELKIEELFPNKTILKTSQDTINLAKKIQFIPEKEKQKIVTLLDKIKNSSVEDLTELKEQKATVHAALHQLEKQHISLRVMHLNHLILDLHESFYRYILLESKFRFEAKRAGQKIFSNKVGNITISGNTDEGLKSAKIEGWTVDLDKEIKEFYSLTEEILKYKSLFSIDDYEKIKSARDYLKKSTEEKQTSLPTFLLQSATLSSANKALMHFEPLAFISLSKTELRISGFPYLLGATNAIDELIKEATDKDGDFKIVYGTIVISGNIHKELPEWNTKGNIEYILPKLNRMEHVISSMLAAGYKLEIKNGNLNMITEDSLFMSKEANEAIGKLTEGLGFALLNDEFINDETFKIFTVYAGYLININENLYEKKK